MKGHTIKGGQKRPTKAGAGMTKKGIKKYRRDNPGSKLKGAVTGTVKKGSKAAKRRNSFLKQQRIQTVDFDKLANDGNVKWQTYQQIKRSTQESKQRPNVSTRSGLQLTLLDTLRKSISAEVENIKPLRSNG